MLRDWIGDSALLIQHVVSWSSPLYTREKGSGNIVYNKLSQRNAIIAYLRFRILNSKTSLLFAGQNDLFYDSYRFYDSFVASITHLFEVNLQSSSGLLFEFEISTVSFLRPELFYFCLPSVLRIVFCHTHFSSTLQYWRFITTWLNFSRHYS